MRKLMVLAAVAALAAPAMAKDMTVDTAAILGPSTSSLSRAAAYSTGFEPGAGFVAGPMNSPGTGAAPEGPWIAGGGNTLSPVISTLNPAGGTQHLRHKDAGTANGTLRLGFSPDFGPFIGSSTVSFDVAMSTAGLTGGADYDVILQSGPLGNTSITARIKFNYQYGAIFVLGDNGAGGLAYNWTGTFLPDSGYHNIRAEIDPANDNIDYYLDNTLIWSDVIVNAHIAVPDPFPGAVTTIVTADDQYQDTYAGGTAADYADFDNFSVTPEPTTVALLVMGVAALARRRR